MQSYQTLATANKFYLLFYDTVLQVANFLMPNCEVSSFNLFLLKNLAGKMFSFFRRPQQVALEKPLPMSGKDFDCLQ